MSEVPLSQSGSSRRALLTLAPTMLFMVLMLLLTFALLTIIMSIFVSFRLGDMMARPNPFTRYAAVWPGQTVESMAQYLSASPEDQLRCYDEALGTQQPGQRIQITDESSQPPENMTCINTDPDPAFYALGVRIKDNQVRELDLYSQALQEDTLVLYWGVPDSITKSRYGQSLLLKWDRRDYRVTAVLVKPYTIVSVVIITAKT